MENKPAFINTERETRIFFWFMTLVLVVMSVFAALNSPELRQPLRLTAFAVLMSIHIILHWLLRRYAERPGWLVGYMLVQGLLAFLLVFLSIDLGVTFAVSMALVGEAIGVYGVTRRGLIASTYYLVLSIGLYTWLFGIKNAGWWLVGTIPIVIFVVMYVEMYTRQSNANERARVLLDELEAANRQLTEYAAQVEDLTIAAERQRMARELHDTLSQGLAGLILQLEAADAHLASSRVDKARQIVQQTMENARATLADARRAIDDLRESSGLDCEDVLRHEVARFSAASGVPCALDVEVPDGLPASITAPVLRIVTEGLANIHLHAAATQASLRLRTGDGALHLEIQDNGQGFDPTAVPEGHYGLIGMRERARLLGGTLDIESHPGQGTTLRVRIPLP